MKPGLAVLPMDVWADVFIFPWISRKKLAQIVDQFKERAFAEKLQTFLHDPKCGKHSLRFLDISSNQSGKLINKIADFINTLQKFILDCGNQTLQYFGISSKQANSKQELNIPESKALLAVSPSCESWFSYLDGKLSTYEECEFPETEMPENIKTFKELSIRYIDDKVLSFLNKIKPLLTNVSITIGLNKSANNMHVLFTYLLPMIGSIRQISCNNDNIEFFQRHFPGTLALAKELDLFYITHTFIPAYLNWLSAPLDLNLHGPRFLYASADSKTIFAIVDAVRKQFLSATTQSAFVIFLQFFHSEGYNRPDELTFENAATKEHLKVRNAQFKKPDGDDIHYKEILRHPMGADAIMREWIEKRAYYENHGANRVIWIWGPTIGHITKQAEDKPVNVWDNDDADGPSTSAKGK